MSARSDIGLTLGFVQDRPGSAAEVLGELEPLVTANFLDSVPARIAAPAFALMHPDDAAATLAQMNTARAAALLRAMKYADALTVVRLMTTDAREVLYQELPKRLAEDLKRSLLYPREVVGAWMEPSVPALAATTTVTDTLRYLRRHPHALLDHLFVIDDAQRLEGTVSMGALVGADPNSRLLDLWVQGMRPLSNRARLSAAAADPAWDEYAVLPVAGRKGNLLGGLSRAQLKRGLEALEDERESATVASDSTASRVASALLVSAAGLLRASFAGLGRHE